jgi:hypothetical protein
MCPFRYRYSPDRILAGECMCRNVDVEQIDLIVQCGEREGDLLEPAPVIGNGGVEICGCWPVTVAYVVNI